MKKKIVIASVLKPVDDVRSYWKLSQSIAKTNKYEVNIIGNEGKKESYDNNIKFFSHSLKRTNWLKRFLIRELILFKILKIKPELLIVTTHELLNTALIVKLLSGCKVVYDVQENYSLNISAINPSIVRNMAAAIVRLKENLSRHFISQFWLAEKCYQTQLNFVSDNSLVIENKAIEHSIPSRSKTPIKLLFSGTISEYGGIRRAINLFKILQELDTEITLEIIGQVNDHKLENWLESQKENNSSIHLNISKSPIPYDLILDAISRSNLGIISYKPNVVNKDKMPTKLYEYSRYHLPYLVQENTLWSKTGSVLGGAIPINFDNFEGEHILETLKNTDSMFKDPYQIESTWEYESQQLFNSFKSLNI